MKLKKKTTYKLEYLECDIEVVILYLHQHYKLDVIQETEEYYETNGENVISDKRLFIKEEGKFIPLNHTHWHLLEEDIENTQLYRRIFIEIDHD